MRNLQQNARRLMAGLLSALLVLTIVSGCGGGGGGSTDYSGTYKGSYFISNGSNRLDGPMAIQVASNGSAVAILDIDGTTGGVAGTVNKSNGNISFTDSADGTVVTITGKVRGNNASGTITAKNGSQKASGKFDLTKTSSGSSSLTAPSGQSSEADKVLTDELKKRLKLD